MTGCGECSDSYSCDSCYSGDYEKVEDEYDVFGNGNVFTYNICKVKCPPNKLRDKANWPYDCTLDCIDNCEECTDATTCDICADGYYEDATDTCTACVANCEICEDGTTCDYCATGYEDGTLPCDTCADGYFGPSDAGVCTECTIDDCDTCTDATTCATCYAGYYVDGGLCSDCIANCMECSDGTTCDYCFTGYEGATCTTCSAGYYDDGGVCKECGANCDVCTATACTTCATGGFVLKSNGKCVCPFETFRDTAT